MLHNKLSLQVTFGTLVIHVVAWSARIVNRYWCGAPGYKIPMRHWFLLVLKRWHIWPRVEVTSAAWKLPTHLRWYCIYPITPLDINNDWWWSRPGRVGRWVCDNTLLPRAHWHYNIDTVSVTTYSACTAQWYRQTYTFTYPREPPSFYSYHTNPPLIATQEILLRLREVALESVGRVFDWKYQHGQRGTTLTTEYAVDRQLGIKTQVNLQCGDFYCLLYTTALTLDWCMLTALSLYTTQCQHTMLRQLRLEVRE